MRKAKAAYSTARVPKTAMKTLLPNARKPNPGDLVLAEIIHLHKHKRIELCNGRRAHLSPGDIVILCYGNRYAPDQFEAYVPEDLSPCHMVAAGGVAARVKNKHSEVGQPTEIKPLGLIGNEAGKPFNLKDWALPKQPLPQGLPPIFAVTGTTMNSGKTTTAACLIQGLSRSGMRVDAAKVTGTGAGGDVWHMHDMGAAEAVDFTSAGFASTFGLFLDDLEYIFDLLIGHLCSKEVDAIVLEIADGIYQRETAALLSSPLFVSRVEAILFAAKDAMGAKAGIDWLQSKNLHVSGVSGAMTASPMAVEEASQVIALPILDAKQLSSSDIGSLFFPSKQRQPHVG
ncbi:MAG: DUF1611 domain-containing protein [Deltaproteobacteria bacterium]|nr:DUF1611 domain-containing protein [Deltaproteobacteria bacterium]